MSAASADTRDPSPTETLTAESPIWRLSRVEVLCLGVILAFSLAVRLVGITGLEPNINPDEADNASVAFRILQGHGPGLFGLGWDGNAALNLHIIAAFLRIFGTGILGMRMASIVFSTLALVPFYLLARERLSPAVSVAATLLFSTSLWYLNFSRNAWINVFIVLYSLAGAWLLAVALRRRRSYLLFAGAGVFAALALYGYFAGRTFLLAILISLPPALWIHRREWRRILLGYGLLLAVAGILYAPEIPTLQQNWQFANLRTSTVSVLDSKAGSAAAPSHVMWQQFATTVRGYILMDGSVMTTKPRYSPPGQSVLDPVAGLLFLAGLVLGLARWRRVALWWPLLFVPLLTTQVLSTATPDPARALGALPVIYLFVGLAIETPMLWRRRGSRLIYAGLTLVVACTVAYNVVRYAAWMQQPGTALARQPAVENAEYNRWRDLQMERAKAGLPGFTVSEWRQMR